MNEALSVRCHNKDIHKINGGKGRILCFIHKNAVYILCTDKKCKRWTRLAFNFPGIKFDFKKAGITKSIMPEDFYFVNREAAAIEE